MCRSPTPPLTFPSQSLAAANSKAAHRAAVARAAQCEDEDCYERLYRSAAEQQLRLRERTAAAAAGWSEGHEAPPEPVLLPAAAPDDRWKPPRAATERTEALFEDSKRLQRKKVLLLPVQLLHYLHTN